MTNDMIQLLVNTDQNLLLYLNGFHNAFGDYFMSTFTGKWIWVPMYASILYVLLKNFNWKITLCCLTAIALTILFADQVCASLIRPAVERLRPSNPANPISDLVHIVNNYRGGRYGFPSCHASNSFGLAFFLVFLFRKRWLSLFILLWYAELLYAHLPGSALSGRPHSRCHHRMLRSSIHVLFTEENSKRRFFWKSETYGNHDLRRTTYNNRNSGLRFNHGIMNPLRLPLSELKHLPYFR